jgi:RNA polymerase sigma-70 factor (ECF subfamily)
MRRVGREVSLAADPAAADGVAAAGPSPSSVLIAGERRSGVAACLETLPDDYRAVIVWHHRDGLPFDEIGRRLGRSPDAARRLWTRAIDRLRRRLAEPRP